MDNNSDSVSREPAYKCRVATALPPFASGGRRGWYRLDVKSVSLDAARMLWRTGGEWKPIDRVAYVCGDSHFTPNGDGWDIELGDGTMLHVDKNLRVYPVVG